MKTEIVISILLGNLPENFNLPAYQILVEEHILRFYPEAVITWNIGTASGYCPSPQIYGNGNDNDNLIIEDILNTVWNAHGADQSLYFDQEETKNGTEH